MAKQDAVQAAMIRAKVPMTLNNYLHWAFMGKPPAPKALDAEDIAQLPEEFQREVEALQNPPDVDTK
jgi:hypothetical protein